LLRLISRRALIAFVVGLRSGCVIALPGLDPGIVAAMTLGRAKGGPKTLNPQLALRSLPEAAINRLSLLSQAPLSLPQGVSPQTDENYGFQATACS
jgi:hypothetical protein